MSLIFDPDISPDDFGGRRVTIVGLGKGRTTAGIARFLVADPARLPTLTAEHVVGLERSSFPLDTLGRSPHVAVIRNVLEDHLDWHGTREAYVAAKRHILAWQGPRDVAVLNLDDPTTVSLHTGVPSEIRGYSVSLRPKRGAYRESDGTLALVDGATIRPLLHERELRVPGRHNVANALAAAVVGDLHGVGPEAIAEVLRAFTGLPHRLESVA